MHTPNDAPSPKISLSDTLRLAAEDGYYRYTFSPPPAGLHTSIAQRGIEYPLVIDAQARIIHGVRRFLVARELGLTQVPTTVAANPAEAFVDAVWDNVSHREFSALELGHLFTKLTSIGHVPPDAVVATVMPACGLAPSQGLYTNYCRLATLPANVTRHALRDHHLLLLAATPPPEQNALAALFAALMPSAGESRQLKNLLAEAALREACSPEELLARPDLRELYTQDAPPRHKVLQLRRMLRRMTTPELSHIEDSITRHVRNAELTGSIDVRVPPDLAAQRIELRVTVSNVAEFTRAAATLASPSSTKAIRDILALLGEYAVTPRHVFVTADVADEPLVTHAQQSCPNATFTTVEGVPEDSALDTPPRSTVLLTSFKGSLAIAVAPDECSVQGRKEVFLACGINCPGGCLYCVVQECAASPYPRIYANLEAMRVSLRDTLSREPSLYIHLGHILDPLAYPFLGPLVTAIVEEVRPHSRCTLEIRTKFAAPHLLPARGASHMIAAFSFAPQRVVRSYERGTASLAARIRAARELAARGYRIGLRLDPVLMYPGWEEDYRELCAQLLAALPPRSVADVVLGTLRGPRALISRARRNDPAGCIRRGEFVPIGPGKLGYPAPLRIRGLRRLAAQLGGRFPL